MLYDKSRTSRMPHTRNAEHPKMSRCCTACCTTCCPTNVQQIEVVEFGRIVDKEGCRIHNATHATHATQAIAYFYDATDAGDARKVRNETNGRNGQNARIEAVFTRALRRLRWMSVSSMRLLVLFLSLEPCPSSSILQFAVSLRYLELFYERIN